MAETIQTTPPPEPAVELEDLRSRHARLRADRDRVSRENEQIREKYHALRDEFERVEAGGLTRKCQGCGWSLDDKIEDAAESVEAENAYPPYSPASTPLRPYPDALAPAADLPVEEQTHRPLTGADLQRYTALLAERGLDASASMDVAQMMAGADETLQGINQVMRDRPSMRSASALMLIEQQRREHELLEREALYARLGGHLTDRVDDMAMCEPVRHVHLEQLARHQINYAMGGTVIVHARGCVCDKCEEFREVRGELRINPTRMRVEPPRSPPPSRFAEAMRDVIARSFDYYRPLAPAPCIECFGITCHAMSCSRR